MDNQIDKEKIRKVVHAVGAYNAIYKTEFGQAINFCMEKLNDMPVVTKSDYAGHMMLVSDILRGFENQWAFNLGKLIFALGQEFLY